MEPLEKARQLLAFEVPLQAPVDATLAEKECFKLPVRMLQKIKELRQEKEEAIRSAQRLWEEKGALEQRLRKYLVRNMIPMADSCIIALEGHPGLSACLAEASIREEQPALADSTEAENREQNELPFATVIDSADVVEESGVPADSPVEPGTALALDEDSCPGKRTETDSKTKFLVSILRSILSLLNSLDVFRVELRGHQPDDVFVEGEKIEDPFEIIEASRKAAAVMVTEVIEDLWVTRRSGAIEVLRKGKVKCS